MNKFLLLVCFSLLIYANETVEQSTNDEKLKSEEVFTLDLNYISSLRKGLRRDFFINEYLQKDITPKQAYETLSLIDNMNYKIFHNFAKKYGHDETLAVSQCINMDKKDIIYTYADCIVAGLTLEDVSKMSAVELDLLKQKVSIKYPAFLKEIKVISSSIPFTKLIPLKKDEFYKVYFGVSKEFRTKYFNYKLPKRTFTKVFSDKNKFDKFLDITLRNRSQDILNKSLLNVDDVELNGNSSFLLGLNAYWFKDLNKAFFYLENSLSKTLDKHTIDKINYWLFKTTKNEEYLYKIIEANNKNFYSILANEFFSKSVIKKDILQKDEEFLSLMEDFSSSKKALLYAIIDTKSNFDSNKISQNFNIGLTQLNINLLKSISKTLYVDSNILLPDFFDIKINTNLASSYLSSLEKVYPSALTLLFAYENKIGILKELNNLKDKGYDLDLAFEFIIKSNSLKSLIANYYLYFNSLKKKDEKPLSLINVYQTLLKPLQTLSE